MRGKIPVHLLEGWWFRCIHVWGVGYCCIYLRSDDLRCIHVWGVRFRCTWGMMISVHSCVRWISVHSLEGWWFQFFRVWGVGYLYYDVCSFTWEVTISVLSCMRGKIPVHLFEGWWFRCIHVWGVGYRCIYLRSDDLRCICVWGVRFRCICLSDDDFGAFMCEG